MTLVDLVKRFEGFRARPYLCPAGYWTIGYGRLATQDHPPIDELQAEAMLIEDLAGARAAVLRLVRHPLTDYQLDAITDWTFNLGSGRLKGSSLRAKLNRGDLGEVPGELRKWTIGGGRRLPGLVIRREAEAAMFQGRG